MALISNIANYLQYNYFWDCDGIDNVTLRLLKFSDFCSRQTVGVAGDDIMFHILVTQTSDSHQFPCQNKTKSKLQIWKIAKNSNFARNFTRKMYEYEMEM